MIWGAISASLVAYLFVCIYLENILEINSNPFVKGTRALYQLLIISSVAMIFFRPRKEELLGMAKYMKEHQQK